MKKLKLSALCLLALGLFSNQALAISAYVEFGPAMTCTIHWGGAEGDCLEGTISMNSEMEPCCDFDPYPVSESGSHEHKCVNNDDYGFIVKFFTAHSDSNETKHNAIDVKDFTDTFSPLYNSLVKERFCR